jgi:hypothetical protein
VNSDLRLEFKLNVPNAIITQGNFRFLNIYSVNIIPSFSWLAREKRQYDLEFNFPYSKNVETKVNLPNDRYVIKDLPSNYFDRENGISFKKNYQTISSNGFSCDEIFSISSKDIKAKHFDAVKNFVNNIKNNLNEKIILTSK